MGRRELVQQKKKAPANALALPEPGGASILPVYEQF